MRPRIGISRPALALDPRYLEGLEEAGAEPVHLAQLGDAAAALAGLAGLVIPGGPDFAPPHGRDPAGVVFDVVPAAQLAFEHALVSLALARRLPLLGICYGMQLLTHVAGGSFVYDIPSEHPEAGAHRLREPAARHPITLEPGSGLERVFGVGTLAVNSSHHQAVDAPGAGLRVVARAEDGIVEAIESSDPAQCVLGVQWHPERMEREHRAALFGALMAAVERS